jgi:hypothetical protein
MNNKGDKMTELEKYKQAVELLTIYLENVLDDIDEEAYDNMQGLKNDVKYLRNRVEVVNRLGELI